MKRIQFVSGEPKKTQLLFLSLNKYHPNAHTSGINNDVIINYCFIVKKAIFFFQFTPTSSTNHVIIPQNFRHNRKEKST